MQIRAVEPGGRERHGCALEAGGGGGRRYLHSARVAACHHADLCDLMCSWISRQLRTPWARAAADQQRSRHDSPTAAARLLPVCGSTQLHGRADHPCQSMRAGRSGKQGKPAVVLSAAVPAAPSKESLQHRPWAAPGSHRSNRTNCDPLITSLYNLQP